MTAPTASIEFEPFAPAFDADPLPVYRRLREPSFSPRFIMRAIIGLPVRLGWPS